MTKKERTYLVIRGNWSAPTGSLITSPTEHGIQNRDAITWNPSSPPVSIPQCIDRRYPGKPISLHIDMTKKYKVIDQLGYYLNEPPQTFTNTIFYGCVFNDAKFHGSTFKNVIFYRCKCDIFELKNATLTDVKFLYCDEMRAVKIDGSTVKDLVYHKSDKKVKFDHSEFDVVYADDESWVKINSYR